MHAAGVDTLLGGGWWVIIVVDGDDIPARRRRRDGRFVLVGVFEVYHLSLGHRLLRFVRVALESAGRCAHAIKRNGRRLLR